MAPALAFIRLAKTPNSFAMDFSGSIEDLKALISLLHLDGHWVDEGVLHTFNTVSGEHINFWPAKGELRVQGHPEGSRTLEERLRQAIAGFHP